MSAINNDSAGAAALNAEDQDELQLVTMDTNVSMVIIEGGLRVSECFFVTVCLALEISLVL